MVSELVMVHFTAAPCYVDSTKLPGLFNPFLLQLRRNVLAYGSRSRIKFMFRASSSLKDRSKAELQKGGFDDSHDTKYENGELPVNKNGTNNGDEQITSMTEEQAPESISSNAALKGSMLAGLLLLGTIGGLAGVGFTYREQLNGLLLQFSDFLEGYGPAGYVIFVAVYAGLEVLAIPAIPLTMSAGLLFGTITGTIIVSISGTVAATVAFLIARYVARDQLLKLAEGNKKFMAIDKAIGENGFRIVTLLRLSPLLPFSLGNYLYGLTSVKLVPYVFGSWLGMLPGTWAYVSAGAFGRALIEDSELAFPKGPEQLLVLGTGLLATIIAATYVTQLAKDAMQEIE